MKIESVAVFCASKDGQQPIYLKHAAELGKLVALLNLKLRFGGGNIGLIDALEAAHGQAPPLVAARLVAQAALDRPASLGAHFRADGPPDAAPARTFVNLASPAASLAAE